MRIYKLPQILDLGARAHLGVLEMELEVVAKLHRIRPRVVAAGLVGVVGAILELLDAVVLI